MDRHTRYALGIASAIACSTFTAFPKDIFVSSDPTWKMPGLEGETYTDLQTALDKVAVNDTVYLQDAFVCNSGKTASISGRGYARVKLPKAAFTLRSESGYVDEAHGKGAYIRGEKDPDATTADGHGDNAIRPVWSQSSLSVIQGLVLEGGSTADAHNYGCGGAVYGPATITNCVIRNVSAYCGGAFGDSSCVAYNTVISNCYAFGGGYGGGAVFGGGSLYNCQIISNSAAKCGGAIYYNNNGADYHTVYSNCVFRDNFAMSAGGILLNKSDANTKRVNIIDCQILDNRATSGIAGGVCGAATMTRCMIAGNQAKCPSNYNSASCGGVGATSTSAPKNAWPILVDCVVSNNYTECCGGGLYFGIATNCTFVGNWSCADGGGAYASVLADCCFIGNCASNVVNKINSEYGNGGGCANSVATNCLFAGNAAWAQNLVASGNGGAVSKSELYNCVISNNWAVYRGAAVYNVKGTYRCYNCLIVGNSSAAPKVGYDRGMIIEGESSNTMPENPPEFYNCTIVDNTTPAYAIINAAKLYNCIVWGNTAPGGEFFSGQVWADHTCQKNLTAGENGNVNTDPKLTADYHIRSGRPCGNAGQAYAWMTDPTDVRSKDLAGKPRILGAAPDMGCYERMAPGLVIGIR